MSEAIIYVSAIAFALYIFPVYVFSYVYVTTQKNYASINISLFKLIPLYKGINELKLNLNEILNLLGDDGGLKLKFPSHYVDLYNKLCITKIIQVCDFGLQNQGNAYAALAQHSLTQAAYTFVKVNGGKTKLKNYVVLNAEHGHINYCLKLVGVINLMALLRLFIVYFWSVINERKIKKNSN
ncbi:MAG: hypothetical protein ACI4MQ_04495 [Candidatus Coproplasma sp.]